MERRKFLKVSSIGALSVGIVGSSFWLLIEEHQGELSIDSSLRLLGKLDASHIQSIGQWNIAQIFTHCAQSVEFSMLGFPEHKSRVFKATVGAVAFSAFNAKGKMTHNLSEAIPGADALNIQADVHVAKHRFEQAMIKFKKFDGEVKEHFAYGKLNKLDYERAHAMHFNNHLVEIVQKRKA